jgi:hypothetical protein
MAQRSPGLIGAIRIDLTRLHETWMEVVFPRQLDPGHVLGKWKPETGVQTAGYYLWAAFGLPLVLIGYPLLLVGYATRFYAIKLDSAATRLGVIGAVLLSVVVWGVLSAAASYQFGTVGSISLNAKVPRGRRRQRCGDGLGGVGGVVRPCWWPRDKRPVGLSGGDDRAVSPAGRRRAL